MNPLRLLLWAGLAVSSAVLATSGQAALVAHFRLEEGFADPMAAAVQSAVGGYSGTFVGGAYYPGWVTDSLAPVPASQGGTLAAVVLDSTDTGNDPYVLTDAPGVLGGAARSFAAWIKASTNQPNHATFLAYGQNSPGQAIRFRIDPTGFLRLEFQGTAALGTSRKLTDGQWHHVAATLPDNAKSGDTIFYIDGNVEPATVTNPGNVINTTAGNMSPLAIGNSQHSLAAYGFNGCVDDVRVYDEQLSQAQVQAIVFGAGNPPHIDKQPAAYKAILGGTNEMAIFNVDLSGSPPFSFQWKRDNVDLPGGTAQNLVIGPVAAADVGSYTLVVSNAFGKVTSDAATLSWGTPPVDPSEATVVAGGAIELSIAMPADSAGYTYQWKKDGVPLGNAAARVYAIPAAASGDQGEYTVEVSLAGQTAASDPAHLRVVAPPSSAYARLVLEDGPAAYWRLGEASGAAVAQDVTTFHPGAYAGFVSPEQPGAVAGDTDPAVDFPAGGNGYIEVDHSTALNRTNSFTIEGWANPMAASGRQSIIASRTSTRSSGYELLANGAQWQFRTGASLNATAETWSDLNGGTVTPGQWHHVVGTYDGTTKRLYVNGQLVGTQTTPVYATLGTPLRIGADQTYLATAGSFFLGILDEIAVYWRALSPEQVADHHMAGVLGAGVAPALNAQPQNAWLVLGDTKATVTFSVAATGSPRLRYQWQKDGVDLPGATSAALTLWPAGGADLGTYAVVVSNAVRSVASTNVALAYSTGPVAPPAQAVLVGGTVTLTLPALPAYQDYTYQWKHAGTNVPGATRESLTLFPVTAADAGGYTAVVTLGAESVESAPVPLSVLPLPTQPYATAVSSANPVAYWRLNEPAGSVGAIDIIGGRTAYSSYGDAEGDFAWGKEGALLGDADGAVGFSGYSLGARAGRAKLDAAYDAALNPPVFSIECWALLAGSSSAYRSPVTSRDGSAGNTKGYLFYVSPAGNWEFWLGNGAGWTALAGTAAALNEWAHLVGTYDGATMCFYVNGALMGRTATSFVPNDLYSFRIGAGASENASGSFFWPGRVDEVAVYGAALSEGQVQAHYAAAFQAGAAPRITQQPQTRATLVGAALALEAKAHGMTPLSYQWQKDGANLPGATNAALALSGVSTSQAGLYRVLVAKGAASVSSAPAELSVLPGQAISVNIQGYNARTIAANGLVAGAIALPNWNEFGYNASNGSLTNLVNHAGQSFPILVTWTAANNRQWNGPFAAPAGDYALLGGLIDDAGVTNVVVTVTNLPAEYQSAGYSVYAYMGAPHANAGMVNVADWYGAVSVGSATNYYHGMDLAVWNGSYVRAVTTDVNDTPADANYAVFSGLNGASFSIVTTPHPYGLAGPGAISGFQIVANVPPALPPVPLAIARIGADLVLSWEGDWVLQRKAPLDGQQAGWSDVDGASSGYVIPTPLATEQYYRLRSR